ncbi:hypothetical protein OS242_10470 [Tumebacillus sp. DT12]|uniref:Sigma-70 family RNA polymerase sigma factor n=1 Tax=Tumebacillus lacus TaxID=2995335 RepID=A0ABT3X0G2_9BACL|nr:hypothetical protein [Tumebacillus lacus]MCX7570388.1 hypothetical protein [Tumebacillus lacus]
MAQTAAVADQMVFSGMEVKLSYKQVEQEVLRRLELYKQNEGRIKVLQKISIGHGMHIDATQSAMAGGKDLLSLVHDKLKRMSERKYLTEHEQKLAEIWRTYMADHTDILALSSKLVALKQFRAQNHDQFEAADLRLIDELIRRIGTAVASRNNYERYGYAIGMAENVDMHRDRFEVIMGTENKAIERAHRQMQAKAELENLRHYQEEIEAAIETLAYYNEPYARLIRMRYLKDESVEASRQSLNISEKTHDRYKKKAIGMLAHFMGITNAN